MHPSSSIHLQMCASVCVRTHARVCAHAGACSQPRNAPAGARARRLREFTMIWSAHVVQTHKCPHGTKMAQPSDADCPCRHTTHSFSRGSGGAACAMLVVTGRASSSDAALESVYVFGQREHVRANLEREGEREVERERGSASAIARGGGKGKRDQEGGGGETCANLASSICSLASRSSLFVFW